MVKRIPPELIKHLQWSNLPQTGNPSPPASTTPIAQPTAQISAMDISNPQDYLRLEGRADYGSSSYPDFLVCKYRLADSAEVQEAARTLGLTNLTDKNGNSTGFGNTAKEQNGRDYVGNMQWEPALKLNLALGNKTLSPRQHADFRELLQKGANGEARVYDGLGNIVEQSEILHIYNEITERRNPWRSEWLDAKFEQHDGVWKMIYNHALDASGNLSGKTEGLEECIMDKDCLADLIFNNQGLATTKSGNRNYEQGKNVYFWHPRADRVARFDAGSDWAGLYCGEVPSDTYAVLGVREAYEVGRTAREKETRRK